MKPAPFDYFAPTSLDEALALLEEHGSDAKVLSGGQSLVPVMNFRLARPKYVVDLGRIPGLSYIRQEDGLLCIGAMTTHAEIEHSPLVAECCPIMTAAARLIGHIQIRSRGTIGGSVAHADPSAEWPMVLSALGARIVIRGAGGRREVATDDFFLTYLTTTLAPGEVVAEIQVPIPPRGHGWSVQEVARRHGDFALVAVAALVTVAGGEITSARMAIGGVGGTAVVPPEAAELVGLRPTAADAAQIGNRIAATLDPDSDIHAPAEYRRELTAVLSARALTEAIARAADGTGGSP